MPKFFRSLHVRLAVLYAVVFSLSVTALGVAVFIITERYLERQLQTHVELNLAQLMVDYRDDGIEELRHDIEERIEGNLPDRLWYFLQLPSGKVEFDKISALPSPGWHWLAQPEDMLMYTVDLDGGYRLGVAADLDEIKGVERAVRNTFAFALIITLLLGAAGGFIISRGFLVRVDRLTKTADRIGSGELSHRIPLSDNEDDFDQLARIINRMLERIENLVKEVQRVSTNIAHDLRTPLGRLRQKLELIAERPENDSELNTLIDEAVGSLDDTLETFSALLRIAEIQSGARRSEFVKFDLSAVIEHLGSAYEAVADSSGRELILSADSPLKVEGDRSLLTQLFANLIENCLQHTPPGTKILLNAEDRGSKIIVSVSDDGGGVAEDDREKILQPFFKVDKSRTSTSNGLGLSIVAAIAKLHEAKLTVANREGGLHVEIEFARVD